MKKVKRLSSVILVALLISVMLAGCSTTNSAGTASPSPSVSSTPLMSEEPSPEESMAAAPSEATSDTIGYLTDKFDHFSRETIKIAYTCNNLNWAWNSAISEALDKLGKELNYDYTAYSSNGNNDDYINTLQILAEQGVEGFITGVDNVIAPRVFEVCTELGVAFVAESTPFLDEEGHDIWPSVQQDQYNNGAMCVQWLADNYMTYWNEPLNPSELGLLVLNFSVVSGINEREPGCKDTFLKLFPEAADNYIVGDLVSIDNGFSMQGGNTMTATTLAGHPEIKKWFIVGLVDDWSTGAARAVEGLGRTDDVLVTSVQADAFVNEMNTGNLDSVYCAACAVSSAEFAVYMACNIVTILEGRATPESIWPEWIASNGSQYASMKIQGTMITKDTYQAFVDSHTIDTLIAVSKND